MTTRALIATLAAAATLTLTACATGGASQAGVACQSLASADGLRVVQQSEAAGAEGAQRVAMRVEDRVGRRLDNTCIISSGQARWAAPFPKGFTN